MTNKTSPHLISQAISELDSTLSQRFIELDPSGYFIIYLDYSTQEIIVDHFSNDINDKGIAIDPISGEPIACNGASLRNPIKTYKARSAKELGIQLTEGKQKYPLSRLDHALYMGRELQRAEECLKLGTPYIQD